MNPGTLKRMIKQKQTKTKRSISKLIKELDIVVSRYVRRKAEKNGVVACYTCPHVGTVATMQCGHYISRWYKAVRWELDNLRPQCMMCNMWRNGNSVTFRENLVKDIGEPRVIELEALRWKVFRREPSWFEEQIFYFKSL